ncbi:signal peptidase II [Candidatus Woesearchaeota archaeon]|nr:signal peptidase II [Candidatus Woesearchaeota archaeon]
MRHLPNTLGAKFILITIIIFIIDRITKAIALNYSVVIKNTGTLFGLWQGKNEIFILISIIILLILVKYKKELIKNKKCAYLTALIVGGAIGNIYDRIIFGSVIDFINLQIWPAFNIADAAITIGIIGLLLDKSK